VSVTAPCSRINAYFPHIDIVPDRRRRIVPEVVSVGRWSVGVLGIWRGEGWVKGGTREVSLQAT
jgi:hypothetical protein